MSESDASGFLMKVFFSDEIGFLMNVDFDEIFFLMKVVFLP